jgi:hypothetical protein
MTQDNFDGALERFYDRKFSPFIIALHDGSRFDVDFPAALPSRHRQGDFPLAWWSA